MQTRFVVVPAVPIQKEVYPRRLGFPAALGEGYDLYDTHDKVRLSLNFSTRAQAEFECVCRNRCRDAGDAGDAADAADADIVGIG